MALQSGIGISRILILAGAGYTGTVLLKNNKLSDILGELQSMVKGMENSKDSDVTDASDAISQQVRRLAMEVRQLASARQITVLNGNSNGTSLIVPVAALGALGYGYMWWKGISFSDLMYVTKRNMANAVSNLTKHLEHVCDSLAATKRHLTQRIENLDGKMDQQMEISKEIKNDVTDVRTGLSRIDFDMCELQRMFSGLDVRMMTLQDKQDIANLGVAYLINFVHGRRGKLTEQLKEKFQLEVNSQGYLTYPDTESLKGLKEIADFLTPDNLNWANSDGVLQDSGDRLENPPRYLIRGASMKC